MTMINIVANDGATTPVSHTFVPQNAQLSPTGYSRHVEKLAGRSSKAWPTLELQANLSTDVKKDHVSRAKLVVPKVSIVDGLEVIVGTVTTFVTQVVSYGLNAEEELKTQYGLARNLLANAEVGKVFTSQTPNQ